MKLKIKQIAPAGMVTDCFYVLTEDNKIYRVFSDETKWNWEELTPAIQGNSKESNGES